MLLPHEENDPEAAVLRFRHEISIHPHTDLQLAHETAKAKKEEEDRQLEINRKEKEARAQGH
jgi:hypothetical protein